MTDTPPTGSGETHLDDEALSAVLDGEASVEESAHADSCAGCRARLGALRDASVLVGTPVPPPDPARREAAIAAALAAQSERATVVPLRRRRTPPTWLAAAAAVIVVVVAAVSLVPDSDPGDDDSATAVSDAGGDDATSAAELAPDAQLFTAAAPTDGGDLGDIEVASLRDRVEGALGTATREADEDATATADDGSAPSPTTMAALEVPCQDELRDGNPDLGVLVYRASGSLDDEAVLVLAFDVGPDRWVYVVTVDGCAIKNQQTYSP